MTPRDKANELMRKMMAVEDPMGSYPMCFETAKQCATICVNQVLNVCEPVELEYWTNVHICIQKYSLHKDDDI